MSKYTSKFDKYKDKDTVYPHKHCSVCNNMIPEEDNEFGEFCSAECSGTTKTVKQGKKKKIILMAGIYIVVLTIFIIITSLGD